MVALPVQVYRLTHSAFAVGLIGAVQPLPVLALGLLSGSIVDSADLRRVLLATSSLLAPRLLPDVRIPAASALTHLSLNVGLTAGPLLAGVLIS
jgi:hypothetical protein